MTRLAKRAQSSSGWLHSSSPRIGILLPGILVAFGCCARPGAAQEARDRNSDARTRVGRPEGAQPQSSRAVPSWIPGGYPERDYKLGIYGNNTSTGVDIQRVFPGSVAQQSGLEARDTIINVAGYQVGLVDGRLYDLGDELRRRVDAQGRVALLVRNHRDGQLVNVPVRFTASSLLTITGSIYSADRRPLPADAILTVRLLDISNPAWQDVVIRQLYLGAPRRWPTEYQLQVETHLITDRHRYGVDAQVMRQGQIISSTGSPTPVSVTGGNRRINLTLNGIVSQIPGVLPIDQIQQWYQRFLGRPATERELSSWQNDLSRGRSLAEIEASILSSSEYFERNQSNPDQYVDEVYRELNGERPSPTQHQRLRELLEKNGGLRLPFAKELLKQAETASRDR